MSVYEDLKVLNNSTHTQMIDMNQVYMEHLVQTVPPTSHHPHIVQSNPQTPWYDYNAFNNIVVRPASSPSNSQQQHISQPIQQPSQQQQQQQQFNLINDVDKIYPARTSKQRSPLTEKSYFCVECSATFSNSSNLKSHRRIHSGERPYVCDICGSSFVQSSNLKVHKRMHTGERPYVCSECGQAFSRSSHLTGHKRTHTGERPYLCGVCHESFVTSTHLRNHMRKHTGERPYRCRTCGADFPQNSALQIHERIHTGERPFGCSDCASAFRSKGDLRSHRKLHRDDRPFSCVQCSKTFKTSQYLRKHLKKCGAPPSGKKRGRPRIAHVAEKSPKSNLEIDHRELEPPKYRNRGRLRTRAVRSKRIQKSKRNNKQDVVIDAINKNEDDEPTETIDDIVNRETLYVPENNGNSEVISIPLLKNEPYCHQSNSVNQMGIEPLTSHATNSDFLMNDSQHMEQLHIEALQNIYCQ